MIGGRFSQREMTVGQLIQLGPDVRNVGALLRALFFGPKRGNDGIFMQLKKS